jgi:hypothetical protein
MPFSEQISPQKSWIFQSLKSNRKRVSVKMKFLPTNKSKKCKVEKYNMTRIYGISSQQKNKSGNFLK